MREEKKPLHIVAVVGVVFDGKKFLAGQRSEDDEEMPGKWTCPGGKVEVGEGIIEALKQEVKEEAGVEIDNIFFVSSWKHTRNDGVPVLGMTFGCDYVSGEVQPGDDMESMQWIDLKQAEDLDWVPNGLAEVTRASEIHKQRKR